MAQQWSDFRRALRKEDREAFDALMNRARLHASAATYAISLDPTESAVLSMLLEHEKELQRLRKVLESVEERQDGAHGSRDDRG